MQAQRLTQGSQSDHALQLQRRQRGRQHHRHHYYPHQDSNNIPIFQIHTGGWLWWSGCLPSRAMQHM